FAVLALEDAHRGGDAVGDPQDGLVVAAVGAFHAQRLVAQAGDLDRLGRVRGAVDVVARAAAVDEAVLQRAPGRGIAHHGEVDQKSTRLNSSHVKISYAVF